MREVRSCDFCGAESTGLFEPLPDSIPGGPRLSLCPNCRDRLAAVVDPLVERLEADAGAPSAERSTDDANPGRAATEPSQRDEPTERATPTSSASAPEPLEVSESRDASGRSQRERAGTPHGYRKVMRFLENRELPMDRGEAEQLAAEAYELEPSDVTEAIDHAVQYGRLREVDGELKR